MIIMAHLNYNPVSLKDMAIRKLAAALFQESNTLASISNCRTRFLLFDDYDCPKVWHETLYEMLDKILKLGLPESLTVQLVDTVRPMGRQLRRWKVFHEEYLQDSHDEEIYFDVPILGKVCWTSAGAVDYRKTAEELVRSDVIHAVKKFKLACLYCLEDCISLIWQELPNENKKYFCNKRGRRLQNGALGLQFWWPYIVKGEESKLDNLTRPYRRDQITFHQYAFQCSAEKGNKIAAGYFFQKLTHEQKEASLMSTTRAIVASRNAIPDVCHENFPKEKISDVLCYLLSLMTPDQQMQIFQEEPSNVLAFFLEWPLQDIFSEIADRIWDFVPVREYDFVLKQMDEGFKNSGDNCIKLFQEFFLRIPYDFRKTFVYQECERGSHFDYMLLFEDIEALERIFRSVDAAARARLVLSRLALRHFYNLISKGRWDVVEVCLREARLSREDKERLKETFMGYLTSIEGGKMKLKTRKWTRFFHFLDEMNAPSKRCSEDETTTEAKKEKT
ncbi:hypothetical protein AVEN_97437-1 [Araneus ventricosus]|uniref:Uncharacterized protein n=1 Tax=Araneus ventricosus TaxID=182803 RepID=A0A4Y2EJ33_ARAVE|nr:hypothetical protein AVEN_97437-1 [Araneus ventricosus]